MIKILSEIPDQSLKEDCLKLAGGEGRMFFGWTRTSKFYVQMKKKRKIFYYNFAD